MHAADPAEATADRLLWKTKGCSWPYGVCAFYRITDKPADAAWCLRCFPQFRDRPAPGSPTEEAESSSSDYFGIVGVVGLNAEARERPLTARRRQPV